ncbi:MAG: hypothetical protein MRY57_00235 [Candidatus Pacebacteria bacterium]|nr:hypothetical protein [Candidatus Paceibacterota bacterium]
METDIKPKKLSGNRFVRFGHSLWKFFVFIAKTFLWIVAWPYMFAGKHRTRLDQSIERLKTERYSEEHIRVHRFWMNIKYRFLKIFRWLAVWAVIWWPILLFFERAYLHPIVLFVSIKTPVILLLALVGFLFVRKFNRVKKTSNKIITAAVAITIGVGTFYLGEWTYDYCAYAYNFHTRIKAQEISVLPETDYEKVHARVTVHGVAERDRTEDTQDVTLAHYVRDIDDGEHYWTMGVEPSKTKWVQYLFGNVSQVFFTKGNSLSLRFDKESKEVTDVDFQFGEYLLFSNNIEQAAIKKLNALQYWRYEPADYAIYINRGSKPDENGEMKKDWVQVIPVTKWVGVLFPMPEPAGVIVIDQNHVSYVEKIFLGAGDFVSRAEVRDTDYLQGQLLIPESYSVYMANCFRFYHSLFAPMPGNHEGDIRIPNIPNNFTSFPFKEYFRMSKVDSTGNAYDGFYHYIPLSPFGDKNLLSLSLFVAGDDGRDVYYIDHKKTGTKMDGPSSIPSRVVDGNSNYDWSKAVPTEVSPVVKTVHGERHLIWKSAIQTYGDDERTQITFGKTELFFLVAKDLSASIRLEGRDASTANWQSGFESIIDPPDGWKPPVELIDSEIEIPEQEIIVKPTISQDSTSQVNTVKIDSVLYEKEKDTLSINQ